MTYLIGKVAPSPFRIIQIVKLALEVGCASVIAFPILGAMVRVSISDTLAGLVSGAKHI